MDYDEQHRICEKEFELDDAYTVAMDAMPEHWKEEADAQLTYLRNMHICYLKVSAFGNWSIDMGSPMSVRSEIDLLTWGAPCQWSVKPPIDMGRPMSVRSEIGPLTWGVPCQCVEKYPKLLH